MDDPKNMTLSSNHTCDVVNASTKHFFILVYSLVFLAGLFLNGSIMKFYFYGAGQHAPSSLMVYLKNLTAADFLLCLSLPLRITHYVSSSIVIQRLYCSFGASAFFLNMYASIIFMGYIAANRYLKIIHRSGTHILQTVRAAHIISTVTWVFLLAPTVTYTILFFITQDPLTPTASYCGLLFSASVTIFFKIIHISCSIIFLLVLVPLIFFYHSTSRRVLLAQQRQLASSGSEGLAKSRRNMSLLVSVFCVCFVPYHLVRLPSTFLWTSCSTAAPGRLLQVLYYLKEATTVVSVFNVCLDPLVYFFLCKTFRAQVILRMSSRRISNQQSETESSKKQLDVVTASQTSEQ